MPHSFNAFRFGSRDADELTGTDRNDWLFGFSGDDLLSGHDGDDVILAGPGDDTADGGAGDDVILGGAGRDVAVYAGGVADYEITPIGRGLWQHVRVQSLGPVADAGTDRLFGVESLYFAADDYALFVDGTNNAVLAGDDTAGASENGETTIAGADLLANDREFDGDAIQITGVDAASAAGAGLTLVGGDIVYDPGTLFDGLAAGETATDTFGYTVDDGLGGSDTATVTVTVTGVNDDPVLAAASAVTIDENTTAVPAGISATDVDSTALTFSISGTDAALFTIDANTGALSFVAAPDFEAPQDAGADNVYDLTVTVADGDGGSDSADIAVTVADVAEARILINEVLVSTTGSDVEFLEIFGTPGASLAGLSIVNIESDDASGNIDNRFDLPANAVIGANGFYLIGNDLVEGALGVTPNAVIPRNFFENSSSTIALLKSASIGGTSIDGSETAIDAVALSDRTPGTFYYGAPVLGPDGSFYPSAAGRSPDGGDWGLIDAFSPAGANTTPTAGVVIQINEVLVSTTSSDVEFLEIFGTPGASLAGLSIVNIESGAEKSIGNIDNRFDLPADAVIGANGYYLVGNALVAGNLGVTPNAEIPTNFFENSSSTIALLQTASITGNTVDGTETAIDAIALSDGDGTETFFYGAQVLGPDGSFYPSAAGRFPDGGDWQLIDAFSPAGQNTTPTAGDGDGTGGPVERLISEVQGVGDGGSLAGQQVTIEAIVVGDFQDGGLGANGDLNGFYLQEEDSDADGNAQTSEGIFVFDGFAPGVDVQVGDKVRVTGTVTEFFGETQLSNLTDVQIVSSGNALPTAAQITFPVAGVTTNSDGEFIPDLEAFEGMLVTVPETLTVSDLFTLGRFGDMGLQAGGMLETYTQANAPDVAGFQAFQQQAVANSILLDDGSTVQNPEAIPFEIAGAPGNIAGQFDAGDALSAGDTVTGLTGVLRYGTGSGGSGDEAWRINPTETPVFVDAMPREETAPAVGGTLTVASFNVLNFFTTIDDGTATSGPDGLEPRGADSLEEFLRQRDKLIEALAEVSADVFGLVELENEYGDQNGDGQFSIQYIVDALNVATGKSYTYADPGTAYGGGDAIMVGLVYDQNTVEIAEGTSVEILTDAGLGDLGIDPGNPVFDGPGTSRAPIAATFTERATGEDFTVAVNHFKSKGSVSPFGNNAGTGDGTGNNNEARLQAAQALDAWLDSNPTGTTDPDVLIIGDLNAYKMEDPVQFLLAEGYTDLVAAYLGADEFAFSFGFPVDLGTSPSVQSFGALDYGLASASLAGQVTGAAEWHINATEASVLDYNTEFQPQSQIDELYAADPFRSSDHDPLIIGLSLGEPDPLLV